MRARSPASTTTEGFARTVQASKIEPGIDVRGVRSADEHRMGCLRRPPGKIGGTKIRRVQLGACDFGNTVNSTHSGSGRVPAASSRQRLARCKKRLLSGRQTRETEHNAARHAPLHELAPGSPHAFSLLFFSVIIRRINQPRPEERACARLEGQLQASACQQPSFETRGAHPSRLACKHASASG